MMSTNIEDKSTDQSQSKSEADDFASQAEEAPLGLFAEFWDFLIHNKKWWLTPIIVVLALFGALAIFGGSVAAPFLYPFF